MSPIGAPGSTSSGYRRPGSNSDLEDLLHEAREREVPGDLAGLGVDDPHAALQRFGAVAGERETVEGVLADRARAR